MSNKNREIMMVWCCTITVIGTGFLCASAGLSWAKLKMKGICDSNRYLMLYYGVCDKVSISSIGDADRHCWEWRDEDTWEVRAWRKSFLFSVAAVEKRLLCDPPFVLSVARNRMLARI